ncbi:MAG: polymer-forming cytoskeletal protein [Proteobacteria bacterium]|nr:polymer-forming cytoskeletal protein [Pseudomonadota bacterium]
MVDENESIIARYMLISGTVECHGRVVLEGTLEGSFAGQVLDIRQTGKISGDIRATAIDCSGHMEGSVVTDSLALRRSGRHVGTVETGKLSVEPGAVLDCALQSGSMKDPASTKSRQESNAGTMVDLGLLLTAFQEGVRPCCMDVPWSARLDLHNQLLQLLEKKKPLIKVTGEPGSGKSLLVEKLRHTLAASYEVLIATDQGGSVAAVLQEVAVNLGIEKEVVEASQGELLARIKTVLDDKRRAGQRVVLLVDDVEKMFPAAMEGVIRTLTNAYGEADGAEMLQLILLGTKEMETKMVATTIEYFEDETNCQLYLEPLNIKDTADYLRFCLQLASAGDGSYSTALFPYDTIRKIHSLSRGNIAAINRLADKALRRAYADGASEVYAKYL